MAHDDPYDSGGDWYFRNVLYFAGVDGADAAPGPIARWQAWWHFIAEQARSSGDPVRGLAARQGFVLTTAQLHDLDISRAQTRTSIGNGAWTAPRAGVVAPFDVRTVDDVGADEWVIARRQHALAASAAVLRNPRQTVSGRSAAVQHGLPTFEPANTPMLTVSPRTTDGRRPAVHARRARLQRSEVGDWHGSPVTTVARTLVDLARHNRRDGLLAADAALREKLLTRPDIDAALELATGWPGVRSARNLLVLADRRAESPLESLLRLAIHDAGLPAPVLQVPIAVPGRAIPYRVDMLWPAQRLILEADGLGKYTGAALRREKQREQQFRRLGYRVERVIWSDVVAEWPLTEVLLREALGC